MAASKGPLDGIIVLDLSRILAGPTATQILGDFGATVIKVENPKTKGDDTRSWGPNYARNADGSPTDLSAYFMAANRNKFSVLCFATVGIPHCKYLVARIPFSSHQTCSARRAITGGCICLLEDHAL